MFDNELIDEETGLATTLPSSWYYDPAIHQLEREHIFMCEWICVGRESDIAKAGAHKVIDVFGESVLLVRNEQSDIKAFYNVCRHRGARLCSMGEQEDSDDRLPLKGGVIGSRIVCPYHAWSYDLDGRLKNAPHMQDEPAFKSENIQLHTIPCETWGGFLFINLSQQGIPDFQTVIAGSAEYLKRYPLNELVLVKSIRYEVNANWKVLCENYNECYHCGPVHPELCKVVPAFREAGGANLDWEKGVPHKEGANTFTVTGTSARRAFPGLDEHEQRNHKGDLIYPNLFVSLARDHVVAFILHARGPEKTSIECQFLFEPYEVDKPDFDGSDAIDFWHLVNRQDWSICERVQQGMNARVHERGLFSPMEDWNLDIRRYVADRIGSHIPKSTS